nr:MAG TPA: hypothetical protein [Caudoviricetes sp.]
MLDKQSVLLKMKNKKGIATTCHPFFFLLLSCYPIFMTFQMQFLRTV